MTTLVGAVIGAHFAATLVNALDLRNIEDKLVFNPNYSLTDGTGADQAKQGFLDTRTLTASANESLDLSGTLTDSFGAVISFTKLKVLLIQADRGNANDVLVGGAASNGFISLFGDATDIIKVKPGGMVLLIAPDANGYGVSAGTADLLKIANSAGGSSVIYTIGLLGV